MDKSGKISNNQSISAKIDFWMEDLVIIRKILQEVHIL
jgi:hypothetical protein